MRCSCLIALAALVVAFPLLASTVFEDPFDGASLDPTKWVILDGAPGISVVGGYLTLSGFPDHKRANTIAAFAPPPGGAATVAARIYVGYGDYQKFGWNVNATEYSGPTAGFYFDTYESAPNTITAIVCHVPGACTFQQIPLLWGNWYELAVRWTGSDATFLVDGVAAAQFATSWTGPLPAGIWNDRWPLMQADWIRIDTETFDADGDGVPDAEDHCPSSIATPTVIIDGCDSGSANVLVGDGCTLADRVDECAAAARNHGQFVSCVAHLTADAAIRRCAARSDIP